MSLRHHELCFGCGRTNLFGLLLELEPAGPDIASGRCFIKQDHQGADRASAHDGIVAAALSEAMALVCGVGARPRAVELWFHAPAPIGGYLELEARVQRRDGNTAQASARASSEQQLIAEARGTFVV